MKTTNKTLGLMLLSIMTPVMAFAQTSVQDIKTQIEALKAERTEIRAQVESGELTKDEARAIWKEKVETLRDKKEEIFQARMQRLEDRFARAAENNPEHAEVLNNRLAEIKVQVAQKRSDAAELRAKVKSGEITREDARSQAKTMRSDWKAKRTESREDWKEKRSGIREEKKAEHREERKNFREDLKEQVDAGTMTEDEAKGQVQERREQAKEKMDARIENVREVNAERADRMEDRRENRKEVRTERRDARKSKSQ